MHAAVGQLEVHYMWASNVMRKLRCGMWYKAALLAALQCVGLAPLAVVC